MKIEIFSSCLPSSHRFLKAFLRNKLWSNRKTNSSNKDEVPCGQQKPWWEKSRKSNARENYSRWWCEDLTRRYANVPGLGFLRTFNLQCMSVNVPGHSIACKINKFRLSYTAPKTIQHLLPLSPSIQTLFEKFLVFSFCLAISEGFNDTHQNSLKMVIKAIVAEEPWSEYICDKLPRTLSWLITHCYGVTRAKVTGK